MRTMKQTINLTGQLEDVIQDLCTRLPEFAHIAPERLLLCITQCRTRNAGGIFAKIVPMRFPDGTPFKLIKGSRYALPQIPTPHGDVLYIIYVYVPRFFDQSLERRLLTLIHELYHIAPAFDGTIRRHGTRAHGRSRAEFNANLEPLVARYLASNPPEELLAPLQCDFRSLASQCTLQGRSLPVPKAVRLGER